MVNALQYLRETGNYTPDKIKNFLNTQRVKYFIAKNNEIVIRKSGRYSGGALFSDGLFDIFKSWLVKDPIGLLNRKEFEINDFIKTYYKDAIFQYRMDNYIFDWFIPSMGLLIEFNEKSHRGKLKNIKDEIKCKSAKYGVYIIKENTALIDCANLVLLYPTVKPTV